MVPITYLIADKIQGAPFQCPLSVLLDSGSELSWINRRALPPGITPKVTAPLPGTTIAGEFTSSLIVDLRDVRLPAMRFNAIMPDLQARVITSDCRYDVILGRDACRAFRLSLDFDKHVISSPAGDVPMQAFPSVSPSFYSCIGEQLMIDYMEDHLYDLKIHPSNDDAFAPAPASDEEEASSVLDDDDFDEDEPENDVSSSSARDTFKADIGSARYDHHEVHDVVRRCTHLSQDQQNQLYDVLSKFPKLFNNELGVYPHEQIHLEVQENATPHAVRAYPVPRSQLHLFKEELERLVRIGVLEPTGRSEWISGTFITPKKDSTVRWVSDFRALNKVIKRKVYPIPRVQDILSRRTGYKFLSKLDISMQYYTFELAEDSRDITTIATPFGLYRYARLPMGISTSPDIAQEIMEKVLDAISDIEIYIDDIACFSGSYDEHMELLDKVLTRLQDNGFSVNPLKCEWAVQETDFLGHWLTPTGIQPWKKKVNAILHMQPPKNTKELRAFLGLVTYYRDMWPKRSHVLAPLTDLLSKSTQKWQWTAECQTAFEEMKRLVTADTLLVYPDHNKPFHIETDASDRQLGAVIKQSGRPVAYFTRKLNKAQRNYTTIEKELLSIVETLREFRSMLLGSEVHIYTDHRNLTHKITQFSTQRVMRWRILIEEFAPTFHYLKGPHNVVADALSRIPTSLASFLVDCPSSVPARPNFRNNTWKPFSNLDTQTAECLLAMPACETRWTERPSSETAKRMKSDSNDVASVDTFLFHPRFDPQGRHPFQFKTIHFYQQQDPSLLALNRRDPHRYFFQSLGGFDILCERIRPNASDWRILVPDFMIKPLVEWYHQVTVHSTGMDKLEAMVSKHFVHPQLRNIVRSVIDDCQICPQVKTGGRQYGELAPRDAPIIPWHEVHLDCIGPWSIKLNDITFEFNALTMIEPVFNLIEIVRIPDVPVSDSSPTTRFKPNKTGAEMKRLFENHWLSRYPMPLRVLHDGGPEFENHDFQFHLMDIGSRRKRLSPHTPTANAVLETTHRVIGQIIRTLIHLDPPQTKLDADRLIDSALATAMHAHRCAPNTAIGNYSPGSLVFQRDMLLDIPIISDILTLTQHRQAMIDKRLLRANAARISHDYKVGDLVYVKNLQRTNKLEKIRIGPYPIIQVHTNSNVTIQRGPIHERISIRHITPYRGSKPAPSTA